MKTLKLNSVQVESNVALKLYGIDLNQIIVNIYNSLLADDAFVYMLRQELNTEGDIYMEYISRLNGIVMGLIDPDDEYPLTVYNLMTSDERFYNEWSNELFEYIIENRFAIK